MRVLLAEDKIAAAQAIALTLRAADIVVDHVDLGEDALETARHYDYDIVVVSMRLPDMDGLELVRRMRNARLNTPILVLTENESAEKRTAAFNRGADDVVARSVDHDELIARLYAIVRRSKGFSNPIIKASDVQINQNSREVMVGSHRVALTGKEYAILELLIVRKGQVLTKDTFLNHLYGGVDEPETKIIDVFICKLRKKLSMAGADNVISTVWSRGYTFRETYAALARQERVVKKRSVYSKSLSSPSGQQGTPPIMLQASDHSL